MQEMTVALSQCSRVAVVTRLRSYWILHLATQGFLEEGRYEWSPGNLKVFGLKGRKDGAAIRQD
jgi:hypothetical protein